MFYLRGIGSLLGFGLASLYGVWITLVRRDRSLVARDYARALSRWMPPPLGLEVVVEGIENLSAQQPCVYIANHQSAFDVPIFAGIYPENTVIVGKKELSYIPFFGWIFRVTGNILIDRSHNPSAVQRLRGAEDAIRERGVSVLVFPEGTRGKQPGGLLPFKKGGFYMAIAAQVPIVPIVASPVRELFDVDRRLIRPGTIRIRVLGPLPTSGLTEADVGVLIEQVRTSMLEAMRTLPTTPRGAGHDANRQLAGNQLHATPAACRHPLRRDPLHPE
ncbi:MAG: lysophospholipid acyltransferase family protein [Gemmatimonadota bacterium]